MTVEPGVVMVLELPEGNLTAQNRSLYRIVNWEDWIDNEEYLAVLARWVGKKISPEERPPLRAKGKTLVRLRSLTNILLRRSAQTK